MTARPRRLTREELAEVNATVRYTMFSVFRQTKRLGRDVNRDKLVDDVVASVAELEGDDIAVRGWYDLAGMRGDADLMVWWHAPHIETLQNAYRRVQRSDLGAYLEPTVSWAGLHRPAEFNRSHVPAFMAGEEPGDYLCLYPFVRSYDWYLLPDDERRKILAEHGQAARDFADVRANTVPAFALGDYEWLLAFEGPELDRIVDLMHKMRYTEARRHVREEVPFFTGPRRGLRQIVADLA